MTKAGVRIIKVSRNAKLSLKILSPYEFSNKLTRKINKETIRIYLKTQNSQPVDYAIENSDVTGNKITMKLLFKNPKNISASTVSY